MAALSITARFPLGTYLGHSGAQEPSDFPDFTRLFSALVQAAGKGSTAVVDGDDLRISPQVVPALRWLEEHPPSALAFPPTVRANALQRVKTSSYRDDGVYERRGGRSGRTMRPKSLKRQSDAIAVAGRFGWAWEEDVPSWVVETVEDLCNDVVCLGEADSPVILEVADIEVTHLRDAAATGFPEPGGVQVRTPVIGRLSELESDYAVARPAKQPTEAADRHTWSQVPDSLQPSTSRVVPLTYRPIERVSSNIPWPSGIALTLTEAIDSRERVRWCVALHKAIAAYLGENAPPLVTGKYSQLVRQPANRLALQYLSADEFTASNCAAQVPFGAFVVLAPADADPAELRRVEAALNSIKRVFLSRSSEVMLGERFGVDAVTFWRYPADGHVRFWSPVPGLIPETRRQRGQSWSLVDAALLSIGHVLRERYEIDGERLSYRDLVSAVRSDGVAIHDARLIPDSRIERYAHRTPEGVVVQPYSALIDLGGLIPETTLCALGQSRHLGGGLLLPMDVPIAIADSRYGARR